MLRAFTGDPFLAGRAFRAAIAEALARGGDVPRLGEGADTRTVADALRQGGLFGVLTVAIDCDEAFGGQGAAGTAAREGVLGAIAAAPAEAAVLVLDSAAGPARQKRYRALGELHHTPTPRFGALIRWVREELERSGLTTRGDVAGTLVDLFGEDLPGIAGELAKLSVLDERLEPDRVRQLVNRPASRSAFDVVDAVVAGDAGSALGGARSLLAAGEPPVRVMAALGWQLDLIARCLALRTREPGIAAEAAARSLGSSPHPTRKALAAAARLDEGTLRRLLDLFVTADVRMKGGGDPQWQLEGCVLSLAGAMGGGQSRLRAKAASKATALGGKSSARQ